jgi:hypothetical protein
MRDRWWHFLKHNQKTELFLQPNPRTLTEQGGKNGSRAFGCSLNAWRFRTQTDFMPEMKGLKPDVALLPVSGTYVMTAEEAAEAAAAIQPKVAIPMHVGKGIGSLSDAERFKEKATVPLIFLYKNSIVF